MALDTREQLLAAAARLFAARGFYGASIAAIADELGLTKQALLHHFGSKEKLYGEILRAQSERLLAGLERVQAAHDEPAEQLEAFLLEWLDLQLEEPDGAQLLMRELLDNRARAAKAKSWYLRPFLEGLVSVVRAIPARRKPTEAAALALVYQLLGAVTYFSVSEPTLTQMFGRERYAKLRAEYPRELRSMVRARLSAL